MPGKPPIWWAGLLVLLAAAAASAHGLYEVSRDSGVPYPVAALYPMMTDGLALVAYLATRTVRRAGYPWFVVLLAACASGTAQAVLLAGGLGTHPPVSLRAGVGAWPAVAVSLAAHLIHLAGRPSVSLYGEVPVPGPVSPPVSRVHLDTGSDPLGLVEPEEDDPLERSADAAVWTADDAEHEPVRAIGEPVEVPERTLTYTAAAGEAGCSVRTIRSRLGAAAAEVVADAGSRISHRGDLSRTARPRLRVPASDPVPDLRT